MTAGRINQVSDSGDFLRWPKRYNKDCVRVRDCNRRLKHMRSNKSTQETTISTDMSSGRQSSEMCTESFFSVDRGTCQKLRRVGVFYS